MKKKTRVIIAAALLVMMITVTLVTIATSQAGSGDISVSYNAGSGTVTVDPSKWDIPVGKMVTLLILKPGSDAENVSDADIVWIDEKRAATADSLSFSFKLRSPAPGLYIVKIGGTDADPVVSSFSVS